MGALKFVKGLCIGLVGIIFFFIISCNGMLASLPVPMFGLFVSNPTDEQMDLMQEEITKYHSLLQPTEAMIEKRAKSEVSRKWGVDLDMEDGIYNGSYIIRKPVTEYVESEGGAYNADGSLAQPGGYNEKGKKISGGHYDKAGNRVYPGGYEEVTTYEEVGKLELHIKIPNWAYLISAENAIKEQDQYDLDLAQLEKDIEQGTEINIIESEKSIVLQANYEYTLTEYVMQRTNNAENIALVAENFYNNLTKLVNVNSPVIRNSSGLAPGLLPNIDLVYDGSIGSLIVQYATEQLGLPYSQGSNRTTTHRDCSSMTAEALSRAGSSCSGNSGGQAEWIVNNGKVITIDMLQPGDLIFWARPQSSNFMNIYHVGIYAGEGKIIDASSSQNAVVYRPLWGVDQIVLCGRPY